MEELVSLLIPIFVGALLPAFIVWVVFKTSSNKDNKNAEVLIKAIENNSSIDADKLIDALSKAQKTDIQILYLRLLRGCMFTFLGIIGFILAIIFTYQLPLSDMQYIFMVIGGLCFAIGISYLVVYFISRKKLKKGNSK